MAKATTLRVPSSFGRASTHAALAGLLALLGAGCVHATPADERAQAVRERASRCSTLVPTERLPQAREIVAAEPLYSNVLGGPNERESRLLGARLRLGSAVASAPLLNDLACHQVDVAVGRAQLRDDDPFALPDAWVSMSAKTEGDSTTLELEGPRFESARAILERARRLAHER